MIRILATSLSGSEHIVVGGVRDKQSYRWETEAEARAHLDRIQWTNVRCQLSEQTVQGGLIRVTWDDQSITEHDPITGSFIYLKGGPKGGRKISKSEQNG